MKVDARWTAIVCLAGLACEAGWHAVDKFPAVLEGLGLAARHRSSGDVEFVMGLASLAGALVAAIGIVVLSNSLWRERLATRAISNEADALFRIHSGRALSDRNAPHVLRYTFLVLAVAACLANMMSGLTTAVAGCVIAPRVAPDVVDALPFVRVQWIVYHTTFGAFLVAAGVIGLRATLQIARHWRVVPHAPQVDVSIRQRAFEHWRIARGAER
jgi:hypothetical protein